MGTRDDEYDYLFKGKTKVLSVLSNLGSSISRQAKQASWLTVRLRYISHRQPLCTFVALYFLRNVSQIIYFKCRQIVILWQPELDWCQFVKFIIVKDKRSLLLVSCKLTLACTSGRGPGWRRTHLNVNRNHMWHIHYPFNQTAGYCLTLPWNLKFIINKRARVRWIVRVN